MTSEQPTGPSSHNLQAVLLSFAQLSMGCSNPASNFPPSKIFVARSKREVTSEELLGIPNTRKHASR